MCERWGIYLVDGRNPERKSTSMAPSLYSTVCRTSCPSHMDSLLVISRCTIFSNEDDVAEASQKMRDLRYKGDISDYLVTLKDLNRRVNCAGQAFRDQIWFEIPDKIVSMIFTVGPIPTGDVECLRGVEMVGKRVEENKPFRRKKDRYSNPHKDIPHHTNVKDKDQHKRKEPTEIRYEKRQQK
jgi:hypothetical protein